MTSLSGAVGLSHLSLVGCPLRRAGAAALTASLAPEPPALPSAPASAPRWSALRELCISGTGLEVGDVQELFSALRAGGAPQLRVSRRRGEGGKAGQPHHWPCPERARPLTINTTATTRQPPSLTTAPIRPRTTNLTHRPPTRAPAPQSLEVGANPGVQMQQQGEGEEGHAEGQRAVFPQLLDSLRAARPSLAVYWRSGDDPAPVVR